MVYESDFSRRNFLNSCAQSGVFHTSSDYKPPSTSTYMSTRVRPADILSTTNITGIGSKDAATRQTYRPRLSPSPQPEASWRERDAARSEYGSYPAPAQEPSVQYCTCCKHCCGGNTRRTFFPGNGNGNAMNSADDMGAYLRKRSGMISTDSNSALSNARPTSSVRNVPVKSFEELREAVAVRRNYVKERKGLFHETGLMFPLSTPDREASASPSLHPAESIRSRRSTISPSPIPEPQDPSSDTNGGVGNN